MGLIRFGGQVALFYEVMTQDLEQRFAWGEEAVAEFDRVAERADVLSKALHMAFAGEEPVVLY